MFIYNSIVLPKEFLSFSQSTYPSLFPALIPLDKCGLNFGIIVFIIMDAAPEEEKDIDWRHDEKERYHISSRLRNLMIPKPIEPCINEYTAFVEKVRPSISPFKSWVSNSPGSFNHLTIILFSFYNSAGSKLLFSRKSHDQHS